MKLHFNKQKQAGGVSVEAATVMAFLGAIALVLGAIYDGEVAEAATVLDALGDAETTITNYGEIKG